MKKWTMSDLRRSWKVASRLRNPRAYRPSLEALESRLTPSNVSVTRFHNDPGITGQNLQETVLTPANVNSTNFGKLANAAVDGYVYYQPLYMANLMIGGTPHNVAFVATEHDSLYAFDVVSDPTSPTGIKLNQLWQRSFINPAAGITSVPQPDVISGDIVPEIGITGAPVIDPATNVLYLVAKTKEVRTDGNHYVQKIYAIDLTSATGADKIAPYTIGDTHGSATFANETTAIMVPGAGAETSGGANPMIAFSALKENQRPSLQLLNGRVYVGWASHGDNGPYHGWVVGFNETTLQPEKIFNTAPNAGLVGIWQSEGAISTDGRYLYFAVGNGGSGPDPAFDPAHGNYSESVLKVDTAAAGTIMPVADYFTPFNWQQLDSQDADLGSGGVMLLPDSVGSTAHPHLLVETGKDGHIYLIDRDNMGKFTPGGPNNIVQDVVAGPGGVWGNPAFFSESATSGLLIYHGSGSDTREFRITNGQITQVGGNFIAYRSNQNFGFPGAQPIISGNGTDRTTYIDWELRSDNYGQQGPEGLYAYGARPTPDTGTLAELYDSNQAGLRDQLGGSVKFTSATEANGWVFVGQEYNFSVFGLFPSHASAPAVPTNFTGMGISPTAIRLNWTSPNPNTATGIKVFRSVGDNQHYAQLTTVAAGVTTFTDSGVTQGQLYYYKLAATNQAGDSAQTVEVQASPTLAPPVLSADNVTSRNVTLTWTRPPAANDHYRVDRSTDPNFSTFTTIASNIPGNQLSYTDSDSVLVSQPGQYFYRVIGFTAGGATATSNSVAVKVGPGSAVIDYSGGFPLLPAVPYDVQANGSGQFAETTARLTNAVNQAGSVFSINEENVLNWNTTFHVRLHEGTQPNYADGFAFVIQATSASAVGLGGGGLGYQGVLKSVAIKFDTFNNEGENGTGGSTGLFYGGSRPTVAHQTGEVNLPLDATMVNLDSQSNKVITLSYAYNPANPGASVLHESITDPDHPSTPFTHDYMVDIPSLLGLPASGNTIGYVGFTGSTGDNSFWEIQDITTWKFTPVGPAAPHNLQAIAGASAVDLSWKATSADEEGYYVERSTSPTTGFSRIASLMAGVTTYHDVVTGNPQSYFYRVQAFNHDGGPERDSGYSNVASGAVVSVAFSDFATHSNLTSQGAGVTPPVNVFPGNPPVMRLTDGRGGEATSVFYNTAIGTGNFSTQFTLRDQSGPTGSADGAAFIIQNDPRGVTALGASGGALGYGGITNSIAVMFDLYSGGSHASTTKLLTGGSTDKTGAIDMGPSGITLGTGHPLLVTLTYDGSTLNETVRDTQTGATFTQAYSLNLAQVIGGPVAYVGFSGGTGGETATQDILNWSGQFAQAPPQLASFMVAAPATATAGTAIQVTVTAKDQNGNTFTGYTGTVHFSSNDGQATLPANYTFTAADMGVHVFTVTLKTAGNRTVMVNDTAKTAVTGSAPVAVGAAAISQLAVSGFPGVIRPGTPGTFTVTATDAYGNTVTGYRGTVHFTSSDTRAMLPANYTFTATDNGTHNFMATLNTQGTQSITATDTVTASITGTQSGIMVQLSGTTIIDFSNGFANHGNLTANGSASFPTTPAVLRLTDGGGGEAASVFDNTVVGPGPFSTTFTFQFHSPASNPPADGFTFVIQNDPRGLRALGDSGGSLGYAKDDNSGNPPAIVNSVAIKFDMYKGFNSSDSNHSSTGLYINGHRPNNPPNSLPGDQPVDLAGTGIDFVAGLQGSHVFSVTLSYDGTTLTETITDTTANKTFTHAYTINIPQIIGSNVAYVGFTGGTGGATSTQDILTWTGQFQQAGGVSINFTNFASHTNLIANTQSMVPALNIFPGGSTPVMRLTDGRGSEASTVFYGTPAGTGPFTTTFVLRDTNAGADGLSFILQDDPRGTAALGGGGGGEGYSGITNSIAVKFDIWTHGTQNSSTGLFTGGQSPDSDTTKDVPLAPINLRSGDPLMVTLTYDGATLTETIMDMTTHAMFSHSYALNLPQVIGGNVMYIGFGGGTGGVTATQDILSWTGSFAPASPAHLRVSAPSTATAGQPVQVTVTALDQNNNAIPSYLGTVHFTSSDPAAVLPANYTFTAADNGVHTFTVYLNTPGAESITATDTGTATINGMQSGIVVRQNVALTLDYSNGFGDATNLTRNGSANFVGPNANAVGMFAGHMDITNAALSPAGSATFANGAYTLTASGSDIWDVADQFQYLYEPLIGNGQIVARLVSAVTPDFWTKTGLMIRADLSAGSANDFMLDTPNTGHQEPVMQFRDTSGGTTADTGNHGTSTTPNVPVPIWLKLVRVGSTFYGFYAVDNNGTPGVWNLLAAHTTAMPAVAYVGLALTAHTSATGPAGSATFDHVSVSGLSGPLMPAVARMTDGGTGEAGSVYNNNKVAVSYFTTTFVLRDQPKTGAADGVSFVIQNDPRGPAALGDGGGAEGYGGVNNNKVVNSLAIKFDLYGHGTHTPLTGLFTNGQDPSQFPAQDVPLTGINLGSGDPLQITLTYNGTTLTETVVDTVTNATFTHDYLVNITQLVGGPTAYVGFSGGTGGETAIQDVLSWTGTFPTAAPTVASLSVNPALTSATAGAPVSLTVTALDSNGHRIAYTGTVHFTSTDPQAVLPADYTFTAADNGQHTFMVTLKTAGNQAVFITDTHNNQLAVLSGIVVSPAAASALVVNSFPSPTTAGTAGAVKVTVVDAYGNVVTGYRGTVHLTSSDPQAALEGDHTFTAADNGSYAFAATLVTAGTQSITATDTATASITGTQSGIVVNPGAAQSLVVAGFPSPTQAGTAGTFTVTAYDAYGNVATGYTGTVSFFSSDPQAQLPADYTFTAADQGSATFTATLFTGGAQVLGAFDATNGNLFGEQDGIVVTPGPVSVLVVTGFPSPTTAGTPGTFTVTAEDAYGNVVPDFTDRIAFFSSDTQAGLPSSYQFTLGDQGSHTFTATLYTAGMQSIGAIDVNNSSVVGEQDGIEVDPAAAVTFVVSGFPSPTQAGMPGQFEVAAVDPYGNVDTNYAGTITFYSSDPDAQLPADYTFTPDDAGTHVFTATLFTPGTQSIGAFDVNDGSIFGEQDNIEVDAPGLPAGKVGAEAALAQSLVVDQGSTAAPVMTETVAPSTKSEQHPPLVLTTTGSTTQIAQTSDHLASRLEAVDLVLADWDGNLLREDLL